MKFVFIKGANDVVIPINPEFIIYIDNAVVKAGNKVEMAIGQSIIQMQGGFSIRVLGNPREIGLDILRQMHESERIYLVEDKL